MLRIVKSLSVIAIVAALAIGATSAVFTSQASVNGNSFATGTLKIQINKEAGLPFSVSNMKPGDTTNKYMDVMNIGTLPAYYFVHVDTTMDNALYDALTVEMRNNDSSGALIYSGSLDGITGSANRINSSAFAFNPMPAGWSQRIWVKVTLPLATGDSVQGLATGFNIVMDAQSSL
ncbi:MAG: TasA family protein [Patescibacteria group bacterium]